MVQVVPEPVTMLLFTEMLCTTVLSLMRTIEILPVPWLTASLKVNTILAEGKASLLSSAGVALTSRSGLPTW